MLSEPERAWWRDRLDAMLDNELDAGDAARFEALARLDPLLADEWAVMERMQRVLRAERAPLCPDRVSNTVMAHVREDVRRSWMARLGALLPRTVLWKPMLATAVLVGVVVMAALSGRSVVPVGGPSAPPVAVADATADVKWVLAYVSGVGSETGRSVRTDVVDPIVNSLSEN
jgi:anti-sigma factor RsiW